MSLVRDPFCHKPAHRIPRVLVSVLNYKSVQDTIETLRCLQRQTYSDYHLQLVDNASPNDCIEQISRVFPALDIKTLPQNIGYTGGNNFALKQGLAEGYDHVMICNEDIEVDEQVIEHLVECAEHDPKTGVVGGIEVCFFTGQRRALGGRGYSWWTSRTRWLTTVSASESLWLPVEYVQGALVLVTHRALEAGVLMDENLFIYFDEADLGFQLKKKQLHAYVDQRVIVRHKNKIKWYNPRSGYLQQRNRLYMVHKYGTWYHELFYHLYVSFIELPFKVCVRGLQGHAGFAWACVLGHVDGMRGRMGIGRVAQL